MFKCGDKVIYKSFGVCTIEQTDYVLESMNSKGDDVPPRLYFCLLYTSSRPSRGPRGAPPSGLLPFAAASSVLYAPPARRGRETRPHTGCRQLQRGGAEGMAAAGWRFAPSRMRGRTHPAAYI